LFAELGRQHRRMRDLLLSRVLYMQVSSSAAENAGSLLLNQNQS
jgi:hypothetical protein